MLRLSVLALAAAVLDLLLVVCGECESGWGEVWHQARLSFAKIDTLNKIKWGFDEIMLRWK